MEPTAAAKEAFPPLAPQRPAPAADGDRISELVAKVDAAERTTRRSLTALEDLMQTKLSCMVNVVNRISHECEQRVLGLEERTTQQEAVVDDFSRHLASLRGAAMRHEEASGHEGALSALVDRVERLERGARSEEPLRQELLAVREKQEEHGLKLELLSLLHSNVEELDAKVRCLKESTETDLAKHQGVAVHLDDMLADVASDAAETRGMLLEIHARLDAHSEADRDLEMVKGACSSVVEEVRKMEANLGAVRRLERDLSAVAAELKEQVRSQATLAELLSTTREELSDQGRAGHDRTAQLQTDLEEVGSQLAQQQQSVAQVWHVSEELLRTVIPQLEQDFTSKVHAHEERVDQALSAVSKDVEAGRSRQLTVIEESIVLKSKLDELSCESMGMQTRLLGASQRVEQLEVAMCGKLSSL